MPETYDIIVLGSGPGGYVAAIRASQLGLKTAIVERESLGGICLNWGCIPTKALLRSAEVFHQIQNAAAYGLSAGQIGFDLKKVVERSRGVASQLNKGVTGLMKKNKVAVHMGEGRLAGKGRLAVTADGKTTELQAKHIIIATGARARELPFAKSDGKRIWTYRHAMTPSEMPSELLVIGSGAIGIEFASFYADLGAKVTVVEMLDRIVPVEDAEVSDQLAKSLRKQGLTIHSSASVESLKADGQGVAAQIKTSDPGSGAGAGGKSAEHRFSHAIVAVGIVPNTEDIGLEQLGVKTTKGHIDTDPHCRTSVPGIWAIGDVTAPPW
nr:FAD-dependent oxidoreductase [Sphingomonas sp.]